MKITHNQNNNNMFTVQRMTGSHTVGWFIVGQECNDYTYALFIYVTCAMTWDRLALD